MSSRREAERFEEALRRASHDQEFEEELAPLVETAQRAQALTGPVPPPPHGLAPGRQRFLAEAATFRAQKPLTTQTGKERVQMLGATRWVVALMALVLVTGLVMGTGQVSASSLPGEPLYGLKLAIEEVRLALTTEPLARARLQLAYAERRTDEIAALAAQGQTVDDATLERARLQLQAALDSARQVQGAEGVLALERLEVALQLRQRTMLAAAEELTEGAQKLVQQLVRIMERVREEAHSGQGEPEGPQERMRHGTPAEPEEPQPPDAPGGSQPSEEPGEGPGPGPKQTGEGAPGPKQTEEPGGASPPEEPGSGPGPGPKPPEESGGPKATEEPREDNAPGPQPTDEPGGPKSTEEPSGPNPTDEPGGPNATQEPGEGNDPGPQPTEEPAAPHPPNEPGDRPGPGPQSPEEPRGEESPESPGEGPAPSSTPDPGPGQGSGPSPPPTGDTMPGGAGRP